MGEIKENPKPQPGETSGGATDLAQYQKRFEDAVADAQYLLIYASSQCPNDIKRDTIEILISTRRRVENKEEINAKEEADFWLAYQEIWKLVQPATAESIKANLPIETTSSVGLFGDIPLLSRWQGERSIVKSRRTINRYIGFTAFVLLLLLIFQIYWVIGNQLTTQLADLLQKQTDLSLQINDNQKEYSVIELRYQQNELDSGKYDASVGFTFDSTPEWKRDTLENVSAKTRLETDLETLKSQLERTSAILLIWSSPWNGFIDFIEKNTAEGTQPHSDKYAPQFDSIDERSTSITKQIAEIDRQVNTDAGGTKAADALNSSLKPQLESINAQLTNLYTTNNDLTTQAANIQKQIDGINDQLNTLSSTDTNAVESLKSDLIEKLTDLNAQAADIQKQIDAINAQLSATSSTDTNTKSDFEKQLADLNTQAADAHGRIEEINNQLSALSSDAATVKSDLEKQRTALEEQLTQLAVNQALIGNQIQNFLSQRQNLIAQQVSPEQIVSNRTLERERLSQDQEQVTRDEKTLERQEQADNNREKSRQAQLAGKFVLDILQGYLLPLLYGVLGAATYVLRDLSKQIENVTYSEEAGIQHLSRISLGALAGIMVGWFSFLINTTTFLGSVSPLAIAFLVGYNIEVFFSLMDIAIDRIKKPQKDSSATEKGGGAGTPPPAQEKPAAGESAG